GFGGRGSGCRSSGGRLRGRAKCLQFLRQGSDGLSESINSLPVVIVQVAKHLAEDECLRGGVEFSQSSLQGDLDEEVLKVAGVGMGSSQDLNWDRGQGGGSAATCSFKRWGRWSRENGGARPSCGGGSVRQRSGFSASGIGGEGFSTCKHGRAAGSRRGPGLLL